MKSVRVLFGAVLLWSVATSAAPADQARAVDSNSRQRTSAVEIRYDATLKEHDRVFARPEDARDLGVIVFGSSRPQLFMNNEILVRPNSDEELTRFLSVVHGQLEETGIPPSFLKLHGRPGRVPNKFAYRLVRYDPTTFDLSAINKLGPAVGLRGRVRFKDEATAHTVAAALTLAAQGFRIELNGIVLPQQGLLTSTREAAGNDGFVSPGYSFANISRAWQLMFAAGITQQIPVAIIDSGFFVTSGGVAGDGIGQADFPNIYLTWNIIAGNADASGENVMNCTGIPCPYHGYQVASVALAKPDNLAGVAGSGGFVGLPMFIRVGGTAHQQVRAADIAYDAGARVISFSTAWSCSFCMSFGGLVGADDRTMLQEAVSWFEQNGVVTIAAAGNDDEDVVSNHVYPCRAVSICVGATSDAANQPASYSNYGASVTIFAPANLDSLIPGGTTTVGGTSISAPLVAGVVAMMQAINPGASVGQIRSALMDSAWTQPIAKGAGKVDRWMNAYGALLQMLNWRIRDDDSESQDPYPLDLSGGGHMRPGRTLNSLSDVDRYSFDIHEYSTVDVTLDYMQGLNWASMDVRPSQPLATLFGIEGITAAAKPDQTTWRAVLVPPGTYEIAVRGGGPNLYNLNTVRTPATLDPDQFDLTFTSANVIATHNDTASTAAHLTTSLYHLTLHKPDASDVDFYRLDGGSGVMFGVTSERPVDIELTDADGMVVDRRMAVTSANFLLNSTSGYIAKISGAEPTRYVAGVFRLPANVNNPKPYKLKSVPKRFDPSDPPLNIVLTPGGEQVFLMPRGTVPRGPISVSSPGELELMAVDAIGRPIARSEATPGARRTLYIPKHLPAKAYYLRIMRDDRDRLIGAQPLIVLNLEISPPVREDGARPH